MFKRFIYSMTGRFFLILLGGTIVSATVALVLAGYEGRDMLEQVRTRHLAERVEQLILTLEATPADTRTRIAAITEKSGVHIDFANSLPLIGNAPDTDFTATLKRALGENRNIHTVQRRSHLCPARPDLNASGKGLRDCRSIFATLLDGTQVRIDVATPPNRLPPPFRRDFLPYLLLFLLCVAALAFIVSRLATKPVRALAQAAHGLGRNLAQPRLPENEGPTEMREAATAFNSMQSQIRHFIEERTYMLAAIAHDLQTPLTRLRLRLEKVGDEELRSKLVNDLTVTQDMVREGLELARSLNAEEPFQLLDLDSLIATICDDAADANLKVTQSGSAGLPLRVQPKALRRCLTNLVDNAVKYGDSAHVAIKRAGNKVIISVVDNGPGIPESQLEVVLRPFQRLEDSRSRNTGGTGLGLTIARNIAEKHRGTLHLRNISAGGLGLEARLELPIA